MSWKDRAEISQKLFLEKVWPAMNLPGELIPVEGNNNPALKLLDVVAGIDYLWQPIENKIYGLAVRINSNGRDHRSFAYRYPTEWERAKVNENSLKATFLIQAFLDVDDSLLSIGMIRTDDLYAATKRIEGNFFRSKDWSLKSYHWDDLAELGISIGGQIYSKK